MSEDLIHLPIEEALAAKWRRGREHYGPVFIGHPLEELDEELLDAMNYAEEAARRGFPIAGIPEDLRRLCERIRAIYRAAIRQLDVAEAQNSGLFASFRDWRSRLGNAEFSVHRERVHVREASSLDTDPGTMVRLFEFVARHGMRLSAEAARRIGTYVLGVALCCGVGRPAISRRLGARRRRFARRRR